MYNGEITIKKKKKKLQQGTSLLVQRLRHHYPYAGVPGLIPHTAIEACGSQIKKGPLSQRHCPPSGWEIHMVLPEVARFSPLSTQRPHLVFKS